MDDCQWGRGMGSVRVGAGFIVMPDVEASVTQIAVVMRVVKWEVVFVLGNPR